MEQLTARDSWVIGVVEEQYEVFCSTIALFDKEILSIIIYNLSHYERSLTVSVASYVSALYLYMFTEQNTN